MVSSGFVRIRGPRGRLIFACVPGGRLASLAAWLGQHARRRRDVPACCADLTVIDPAPGDSARGFVLLADGVATVTCQEPTMIDHRKLGRELGIFHSDPRSGAGLPIWLPAGAAARHAVEEYLRELERRNGYQHVYSPPLGRRELFELSGHLDYFDDDMFPPMRVSDDDELMLRPGAVSTPLPGLPRARALVPGAAVAGRRDRRHVPQRAVRGARRAEPGARDPPQRRAHLLPAGRRSAPRWRGAPSGRRGACGTRRAGQRAAAVAARAGCEVRRRPPSRGSWRSRCCASALARPVLCRGAGRGRVLRPEDRHSGGRRRRPRMDPLDRAARLRQARAVRFVLRGCRRCARSGRC